MVYSNDSFKSLKGTSIIMVNHVKDRSSLTMEAIESTIGDRIRKFIDDNREYLLAALEEDYEELPDVQRWDDFYDSELKPEAVKAMQDAGYGTPVIEERTSYYYWAFYRSILPTLHEEERIKQRKEGNTLQASA